MAFPWWRSEAMNSTFPTNKIITTDKIINVKLYFENEKNKQFFCYESGS